MWRAVSARPCREPVETPPLEEVHQNVLAHLTVLAVLLDLGHAFLDDGAMV